MFAVRGLAVSFSIFILLYGALSVAVRMAWRRAWLRAQHYSARRCADLLFALRLAPFVIATAVTFAFVVPSFLLLEPRTVSEPIGSLPVVLGLCGIALAMAGTWNAVLALRRASRTVAQWSNAAQPISSGSVANNSVSLLRSSAVAPPLSAAGILRPTVWLSQAAESVLSQRELQSALRHEVVHIRRRDNLRKLILCLLAFPGTAELERTWREATEMAADDAAVSSASEALDLASAVIKLSRLARLDPPPELTTALVRGPAESVNERVERLLAWTERRENPSPAYSLGYALGAAVGVVATLAITYSELLVRIHTATEWLVR
ncbi:MAG: M56 family metallopeptidase [Candidatus Sulfotelmatobacter sp.]